MTMSDSQSNNEKVNGNNNEKTNAIFVKENNETILETVNERIKLIGTTLALQNARERAIKDLFSKEITLEEIINSNDIDIILPDIVRAKLVKEADYKTEKWMKFTPSYRVSKADEKTKAVIRDRVWNSLFLKMCIDYIVKSITCFYGVMGTHALFYIQYGYSVASRIRNEPLKVWKDKLENQIKVWSIRHGGDEKLLKAIALAVAKLTFELYGTR